MAHVEKQIVGTFISGGGSTVLEIFRATCDGRLSNTELRLIASSRPEKISDKLKEEVPPELFVEVRPENYRTREEYGEALIKAARAVRADIIGQYGHTPLTPENVIVEFPQMINQHPGPIDPGPHDFGGRGMSSADRVHTARLLFVRETRRNFWTEVTAQRVSTAFDAGKVLKRGSVEIRPDDTVETLGKRAILVEREIQVATLKDFEEGTVVELPPYPDLVLRHEIPILIWAKKAAQYLYPPEK